MLIDLPSYVICIIFYADDSTPYSNWDQASDLWQQLDKISELACEVTCWFQCPKKLGRSVLEEKSHFKVLGLSFSSKLDSGSYIVSIATVVIKLSLWNYFLLKLLYISINLPHNLSWNSVVVSGLVFPVATRTCFINYRNGYVALLVGLLPPLLNLWLNVEI